VPLPSPEAPLVSFTQVAGLLAVQAHQLEVITPTDPIPPAAVNVWPPKASA
jgi:hypothetical protein